MARIALALLGGFRAQLDGTAITMPTRKAQALLAYLALTPGQTHPRDKLAALLWGSLRESQARGSLRQALTTVRRVLGDSGALQLAGGTVGLDPAAIEVDVALFEAHVAKGSVSGFAEAARLYRGDLLSGLDIPEGAFQEWLLTERERLHELAVAALGHLLAEQRAAGELEAAAQTGERLVALDPLQEAAHRALMRLLVQLGRRSAALRVYQQCVAALGRELGAEPEAETRALHEQILRERPLRPEHLAAADAPAPPPALAPSAGAPLIGREGELARLREALDLACKGRGLLVGLIGEAGVGKSRLVAELAADTVRRGGRALVGLCYETEQILPLAPWIDALRTGRLGDERALLEGVAPPWRAQLEHLLPELGAGTGARAAADPLHVFEAMAHLLEHLAADRPLLVAIEDCHWSDDMSLRLIAFLSRRLEGQRILLIGTAREEAFGTVPALAQVDDELRRTRRLEVIHLRPLSPAETGMLAARVIGAGVPPDALAAMQAEVWRTSEGNPFVALETLRALREHPPDRGELPLPRRVHQLLERRLEQLSEVGRALVAVAAAIGRRFDWRLLHEATGLTEEAIADGAEELVRHHVLQEAGDGLEFTHDRLREVAYAQLLPARRVLLHAQIGRALETLATRERDRGPLALGVHYRAGLVWDKAFTFLEQAGTEAAARGASVEAMTCFEQALEALDHLPREPARQRRRFDLHHRAIYDLYRLGRFPQALERCTSAELLARELDDPRQVGHVLVARAYTLATIARYAESIESGEHALEIARAAQDLSLHVWARIALIRALYATGAYRRVVELGRWVLEALAGVPVTETLTAAPLFPAVRVRTWLALALARTGELTEARATAEEAVRLADVVDDRGERAWALYALARVLMTHGEYAKAIGYLEQTLVLYAAAPVASAVPRSLAALALAHTYLGRSDRALELLERATREAEGSRVLYGHSTIFVHASVAHLLAGRREEASRAAAQALALTRQRGERGEEAWALLVSADVAAAQDPPDAEGAIALYCEGLAVTGDLGIESLEARCLFGLAALYDRVGRRGEARAAAARAVELFGRLGIAFWRDRAQALAGE